MSKGNLLGACLGLSFALFGTSGYAMSEAQGWNIGSALASGFKCESEKLMMGGQTAPVMKVILERISPIEREFVNVGYLEGLKRKAIYSINHRTWAPWKLDRDGCEFVTRMMTNYRTLLGLPSW
jgi:hypothetical protein